MITIDQLLESVDLDFEPRFITKDTFGTIILWKEKPTADKELGVWNCCMSATKMYSNLKLAEFDGKDWTECIYEIKKKEKPVAKIEKLNLLHDSALLWGKKINDLVEAVNEINENYACIAALTDIRKRLDTLENEGVKNE